MKCFEHQAVDAVGVCTHCGKGACPECIKVSAKQIACSRSCLKEIVRKNEEKRIKRNLSIIRCRRMVYVSYVSIVVGLFMELKTGFEIGAGSSMMAIGALAYIWASLHLEYILVSKDY